MSTSFYTRSALSCMLLLSIGLSALTPTQRANIQEITKLITEGTLSESQARDRVQKLGLRETDTKIVLSKTLLLPLNIKILAIL